jgi:DNA-binding MarR family transcriptional regulator
MTEDVVRALGLLCLGTRLKRLGERLQAETDVILGSEQRGLSASQNAYLMALDRLGPLSLGDLAAAVGVRQPGATRAVNALITQGFLTSQPTDGDQRRKIICLTVAGEKLVAISKSVLWPRAEQAVTHLCDGVEGSLLDHLNALEDRLDHQPLWQRVPPLDIDPKS